jgi:hypothetical protein
MNCLRCARPVPGNSDHRWDWDYYMEYCAAEDGPICKLVQRVNTLEATLRGVLRAFDDTNEYVPPDTQAVARTARVLLEDRQHLYNKFCGCDECRAVEEALCPSSR